MQNELLYLPPPPPFPTPTLFPLQSQEGTAGASAASEMVHSCVQHPSLLLHFFLGENATERHLHCTCKPENLFPKPSPAHERDSKVRQRVSSPKKKRQFERKGSGERPEDREKTKKGKVPPESTALHLESIAPSFSPPPPNTRSATAQPGLS